ncbi:DUF4479 domain-containing protein [Virgibacillus sp. NKC19-3]|uniref:YtpR family tRNA-binding protein n=1 Tax=Virgibacillus saliphilus TaxID=2831674 RepID=UPI001C9A55E0|nr:DUF4479 domain-containing protein [Virgibacillus sp. NKC19-3]MBY7143901.1 DUF4479 domain-containing protein [Virgibacillus sp. NKC19-3]
MFVFYNATGIGDVLIIPLKDGDRYDLIHETTGPITTIMNSKHEVLGYNIFDASKHLTFNEEGKIILTEELLNQIKVLFQKSNLDDDLDFDLSPKFVVGYVTHKAAHDNADNLSVCQVDVGDSEQLQIVCGAPNVEENQKVVVAKVGAIMPSGLKIKPTELRGIASNGMMCSRKELGLPHASKEKGILILEDSYTVGEAFNV